MSQQYTPGRKPDYTLSALDKTTGEKNVVGAAWRNSDGSIRIKINAFVVLPGGSNTVLTLFDVEETARKFGRGGKQGPAKPPHRDDEDAVSADGLPF